MNRLALGELNHYDTYLSGDLPCGPEQWIGSHLVTGELWRPQDSRPTPVTVTMTIDGFAGDWDSEVPTDPPRIAGSLSGDLSGPFEAVRCAALDTFHGDCN